MIYAKANVLTTFQEFLDNIFKPLWDVSINPESDPLLAHFLDHVGAFDSVDNESGLESDPISIDPSNWDKGNGQPPYSYYSYFLWANLATLNAYRLHRGQTTFDLRPHCGESGDADHMIDGFLLAQSINHGIKLSERPTLEYLYYLAQVGLAVSPLSNNALFLKYSDNPFPRFLKEGLNVTLSTDGPLQFHHTSEPLIEEYGIATKYWKLSSADVCEVSRNSILQCGFRQRVKTSWLGPLYFLHSSAGNVLTKSHIPNSRVGFRYEVYQDECSYIERRAQKGNSSGSGGVSASAAPVALRRRAMATPDQEELAIIQLTGKTRQQWMHARGSAAAKL